LPAPVAPVPPVVPVPPPLPPPVVPVPPPPVEPPVPPLPLPPESCAARMTSRQFVYSSTSLGRLARADRSSFWV